MSAQGLAAFRARYRDYQWEPLGHRSEKSIRGVYRLIKDGKPTLYIKVYDPRPAVQKIVNRLRPRTLYEARMLERLKAAGIRVPAVEAHLTSGGATGLVTQAIFPAQPIWELPPDKQAAVLLDMAVALLNAGFFYADLHTGNILMDAALQPVLVDAYEVRPLARVGARHIVALFAQVDGAFNLSQAELAAALGRLKGAWDVEYLAERIKAHAARERARRVGRWIRRSLRPGSFSRRERTKAYTAIVNRRYGIDIPAVIAGHPMTTGALSTTQGDLTYTVQTFPRARRFAKSPAVAAWSGLLALYFNDIPCVEPVAVVEFRDGRNLLVTTSAPPQPDLAGILRPGGLDHQAQCRLADAAGESIARMHLRNIMDKSLSGAQLKVSVDPSRCVFLPGNYIEHPSRLTQVQRSRALSELACSLGTGVSPKLAWRFLKAYGALTGDDPQALMRACVADQGGRS